MEVEEVLDLTEDPQVFPVLPEVMVADLAGLPALVTSQELTAADTYRQITDAEVLDKDSAVPLFPTPRQEKTMHRSSPR